MGDYDIGKAVGWLAAFILFGLIVFAIFSFSADQWWYSFEYGVDPKLVSVDARPTDCDFMHAPLGSKDCHYQRGVTAYNARGEVVGGDYTPKYSHDTKTGRTLVSRDNGVNWDWLVGDIPDPKVARVWVTWIKVTD